MCSVGSIRTNFFLLSVVVGRAAVCSLYIRNYYKCVCVRVCLCLWFDRGDSLESVFAGCKNT